MSNFLINLKGFLKNNVQIFIILGVSFFLMSFTLFEKIAWGNDYPFHIANILSLDNNITPTLFDFAFSKITNIAGFGLGYGTYIFYPILSHLFTAYTFIFTKIIGLNLPQTMEFVKMMVLFFSGLTMYFLVKKISNNKNVGLISAISYICAPYFLSDIYVRCAFAEIFTFIFMPLILNGLYELICGNKDKFFFYFIVGYLGLMLSHLVIAVYFLFVVILFLLFNLKKILTKDCILPLSISGLLILVIASSFYVPMLEHKILGDYVVFQDGAMINDFPIQTETLFFNKFLSIGTDSKHFMHYGFNIVMICFVLYVLFNYNKIFIDKNMKSFIKFLLFVCLVFIILISSIFPWDKMPSILQMIQFPWRLLSFVILGFSVIAGFIVLAFPKSQQKFVTFVSVILLMLIGIYSIPTANLAPPNLPSDMEEWGMGAQHEYLPVNAKKNENYLKNRDTDILTTKGNANIKLIANEVPYLKAQIELKSDEVVLELPRIYYLGYYIDFIVNNKHKEIDYKENKNGLIEVTLAESGTLIVTYTGTKLDKICNFISFGSVLFIFIYLIYKNKYIKRKFNHN